MFVGRKLFQQAITKRRNISSPASLGKYVAVTGGGGAALWLTSNSNSACEPPSQRQYATSPIAEMLKTLGPDAFAVIWALGSVGIVTMLALSARTARRGERAQKLIQSAEKLILNDPQVMRKVGHVFAGGNYKIAITPLEASGWYGASLQGKIQARVFLHATRTNDQATTPWEFPALRLEIDKAAVMARAYERRATAEKAGYYGKPTHTPNTLGENSSTSSSSAAAVASTPPPIQDITGNIESEDESVIVFQLRPPPTEDEEQGVDVEARGGKGEKKQEESSTEKRS